MGIRVGLEILAVLLLLTPIVSDGLLTSKCELVKQLMSIIPADVMDRETLVAKIVCHAGETSGFDTTIVKQVSPLDLLGRRKTRAARSATNPPPKKNPSKSIPSTPPKSISNPPPQSTNNPPPKSTTNPPPKSTQMPKPQPRTLFPKLNNTTQEPMFNNPETLTAPPPTYSNPENEMNDTPPPPNFHSTYMNPRQKRSKNLQCSLYGVFQLASCVTCMSSSEPSMNICNMDCSKLIDDDLTDDISCVLTIINSDPTTNGIPEGNNLIRSMNNTLLNSCANLDYSQYLADCTAP